jgi:2-keto-4-pentenoate hydratase/2-oxohepta-3-ene-1,7-dioic acid hydratase in catechol pathway
MKLVTYENRQDGPRLGAIHGDIPEGAGPSGWIVDLAAAAAARAGAPGLSAAVPGLSAAESAVPVLESLLAVLAAGEEGLEAARSALRFAEERGVEDELWGRPFDGVRLRAPIQRPGKVLALAGNYEAHRSEGGVKSPLSERALPEVFCKPATSVIGPEESILLPGPPVVAVDYEGELGVVIGRRCRGVGADEALDYVAGYLCANDVSGRALDPGFERDPEILDRARYFDWLIGKWCDTFCPLGPWLTTADEVPDPMALHLETYVNGERRQETSTGEMIHSIARTIAWCSALMTLEPGDVIATGTPAGVGSATGRLLKEGDVVEVRIGGLGVLRNPVASA